MRPRSRRRATDARTHPNHAVGERLTSRSRRGIVGRYWWAQKWSQLLGETGLPDRLHRGRALARAGSVFGFRIEGGLVRGEVRQPRTELHEAVARFTPIADDEWPLAFEVLASRAKFTAGLLSGKIVEGLEERFSEVGLKLFPAGWDDLDVSCSCGDPARPCCHLAAVLYLMAERLDKDPFLLFRYRGCRRDRVLLEVRKHRVALLVGDPIEEAPEDTEAEPLATTPSEPAPASVENPPTDTDKDTPSDSPAPDSEERNLVGDVGSTAEHAIGTDSPPSVVDFWGDANWIEVIEPTPESESALQSVLEELGLPPHVEPDSVAESALREAYEIGSQQGRDLT